MDTGIIKDDNSYGRIVVYKEYPCLGSDYVEGLNNVTVNATNEPERHFWV